MFPPLRLRRLPYRSSNSKFVWQNGHGVADSQLVARVQVSCSEGESGEKEEIVTSYNDPARL